VVPTGAELYTGIRGRHRIQPLAPAWAERLDRREGDLIEIVSAAAGAPLRAWLRLDGSLSGDDLPLDALGMALLAVSGGERVLVRAPVALNSANDLGRRAGPVRRVAQQTRGERP
jgi:hypothetical protein